MPQLILNDVRAFFFFSRVYTRNLYVSHWITKDLKEKIEDEILEKISNSGIRFFGSGINKINRCY